jgi:pimeloyl-ACP methyl ester carboxylesterase
MDVVVKGDKRMNRNVVASGTTQKIGNLASARDMTISGRMRLSARARPPADYPLLIAIHGGTYTSAYFDVPGYSLLDRAATVGIPAIAIDRPGYGASTAFTRAETTVVNNAELLEEMIGSLWQRYGEQASGIVLIGHSIGGAVVLAIAARQPAWPLLGVATSGCLLSLPTAGRDEWASLPDVPMIELDSTVKDGLMFGPRWSYDQHMPQGSRIADAPAPRNELFDMGIRWPDKVRTVAAEVRVPVHHRQGEYDPLWITNADQVKAFGMAFTSAPEVDARLLAHAGHCIDFHRVGGAFQLDQLAFALRCCIAGHQ